MRQRHEEKDPLSFDGAARSRVPVGLGLRGAFAHDLLARFEAGDLAVDFVEVAPENHLTSPIPAADKNVTRGVLDRVREHVPVVTHGLTLSLAGFDRLDARALTDTREFLRQMGVRAHSDHLCITSHAGRSAHDLLPIAFKESEIERIAARIRATQDALGVPLAIENVSQYWRAGRAEMSEPELLTRVCEAADCGLLLDVNNVVVNARNFGLDPRAWLRDAPLARVVQIHVAGHEWFRLEEGALVGPTEDSAPGALAIDSHGAAASPFVLELLSEVLARTGAVPIVLERDHNIPPLDALLDEVARIRAVVQPVERNRLNR